MSATEPVSSELATMLSGCTTFRPWAEQDEGPYHRDKQPVRRDIVEDRPGAALGIRLAHEDGSPATAAVEIWHCDALGRYSGFQPPNDSTVVTSATAPTAQYSPEDTFLRGSQPTNADGMLEFRTIYPGWYPGRTVHIHLIVQVGGGPLTSQLYFPEHDNEEVLAKPPYAARQGRDTTNATDTILPTGGSPAVLDVQAVSGGYRAAVGLILPSPS